MDDSNTEGVTFTDVLFRGKRKRKFFGVLVLVLVVMFTAFVGVQLLLGA